MAEILEKVYDPQRIEAKWYQYWEEHGFFRAAADGAKRRKRRIGRSFVALPFARVHGGEYSGYFCLQGAATSSRSRRPSLFVSSAANSRRA